jgi:sRNA-binding carbon storage regulator CsrA
VCSQPAQVPVEEVIVTEDIVDAIDPNQISLLDQIADMEADMMDEDIRYAANEAEETILTEDELAHQLYGVDNDIEVSIAAPENEELNEEEEIYNEIQVEELTIEQPEESILQYTDKDGNTFESIEFHNAAVEHSLTPTPEEYELYEADLNILETKKIDKKEEANFDLDFTSTTDAEDNESVADFF